MTKLGSDVCVCGDYRSQHAIDGHCGVCRNSKTPYDGCDKFCYSRRATGAESVHWEKFYGTALTLTSPPLQRKQTDFP